MTPETVERSLADEDFDGKVAEVARELLAVERSETREVGGQEVFFDVHTLPQHLVIFGAVHVAQPLSRYAQDLGFRVTVVDARKALATEERFPNVELVRRFLPQGVRPPLWREIGLLTCSAFYAFFAYFVIRDLLRSMF